MSREMKTPRKRQIKHNSRKYELLGIVLFALGLFFCISLTGQDMGILGQWMKDSFHFIFGITAMIPGLFLCWVGFRYVYKAQNFLITRQGVLWSVLYILLLCWIHHMMVPAGRELEIENLFQSGGIIGGTLVSSLHAFFGNGIGTTVFLLTVTVAGVLLMTHWSLTAGVQFMGKKAETQVQQVQNVITEKRAAWEEKRRVDVEAKKEHGFFSFARKKKGTYSDEAEVGKGAVSKPEEQNLCGEEKPQPSFLEEKEIPIPQAPPAPSVNLEKTPIEKAVSSEYQFPPFSILHKGKMALSGVKSEAQEKVNELEAAFRSFDVSVKITHVSVGPTVTRYELEPAPGVKVSRITRLQDDIALKLAATHVRIEAPIPGKSAVGIEVPNKKTTGVALRDVLESETFQKAQGGVPVALGKDITGRAVVTDLTKMPHLLIAGSTGSGKSVCINTIITSILYHERPEEVKLILIDPKVVELSVYNGIPHLRIPVVTEPKKAAGALHWAVKEMENRYQQFAGAHVRDIGGFNRAHPDQHMPFIIIIIDELADLMMVAPDSVEDAICRLAQKARAAGIHLLLATQRPSVDVITGIIKANIPSRISFAVSSQIDSRTILDMSGAEKLIGKGDMLFKPGGMSSPIRVQGAFISDEEVEQVTKYIKAQIVKEPVKYEEIDLDLPEKKAQMEEVAPIEDELFPESAEWVVDTKKASVSMLQRRFRIGYTRAGRLMDTLERRGIVSAADGAKPREVLVTREQLATILEKTEEGQ